MIGLETHHHSVFLLQPWPLPFPLLTQRRGRMRGMAQRNGPTGLIDSSLTLTLTCVLCGLTCAWAASVWVFKDFTQAGVTHRLCYYFVFIHFICRFMKIYVDFMSSFMVGTINRITFITYLITTFWRNI